MTMAPVVTVGLLWHTFGHNNLGIDALARGHAHLLRLAAEKAGVELRLVALGAGTSDAVIDLPPNLAIGPEPGLKRMASGDLGFIRAVRACDIVFDIGEGDSFTDIYGRRRFILQAVSKLIVQSLGKPLYLAPQTIGPFDHPVHRKVAVAVMKRSAGVFARDGLSTEFLKANGVYGNIDEFIDVAFALPFEPQPKAGDRVRVGLNVSGLLYNGGYTGRNELGMKLDYRDFTHRAIEMMLARSSVEIHLIPHVHAENDGLENDAPVLRLLLDRYPGLVLSPMFESAGHAKSYMSGLDLVVAGRMHACIGAFSSRTAVLPVAYSRKFNGLFGTLGYEHFIDGKIDDTTRGLDRLAAALDDLPRLRDEVDQGIAIGQERLSRYVDVVSNVMSDRARIKDRE